MSHRQLRLIMANFVRATLVLLATLQFWLPDRAPAAAFAESPGTHHERLSVEDWFTQYDAIRRNAQMSLREKLAARRYLDRAARGKPNDEEEVVKAKQLASRLSSKYEAALNELNELPEIDETRTLHQGYSNYFSSTRQLFLDFEKYQGNFEDSLRQSLMTRKAKIETLDKTNKRLDGRLRKMYHIDTFKG